MTSSIKNEKSSLLLSRVNGGSIGTSREPVTGYGMTYSKLKNPRTRQRSNSPSTRDLGEICLSWEGLSVTVEETVNEQSWRKPLCFLKSKIKEKKVILDEVSGIAKPNELSFVMGGSGSGKTTLLSTLSNSRDNASFETIGSVTIQGTPVKYCMNKISAYVQQYAYQLDCLTVWEHVWFHASLRANDCPNKEDIEAKVNNVLKKLDLFHISNIVIGQSGNGISGGERKRLSLATELLADPPILFVDEPTSGLDSRTAYSIIQVLKTLSDDGRIIIITIHQPSAAIFELCGRLTLIHEGKTAYHGPVSKIPGFLADINAPCPQYCNMAEHMINLLSDPTDNRSHVMQKIFSVPNNISQGDVPDKVSTVADMDTLFDMLAVNGSSAVSKTPPFILQLKLLLWRSAIISNRHPQLGRTRIILTVFMAMVLGFVYFQTPHTPATMINKVGLLSLALMNHTILIGFIVMRVIVNDKKIFKRERKLGMYSAVALFFAQNTVETPWDIFLAFIYTTIIYFMVGFQNDIKRYVLTCSAVAMSDLAAVGWGMMLSGFTKTLTQAQVMNIMGFSILLIFGGSFINTVTIPVYLKWVRYLSWMAFSLEICVINEFGGQGYVNENTTINGTADSSSVLDLYGYSESNYLLKDFGILLILNVFYRSIALLMLEFKDRPKESKDKPSEA